MSLSQWGFDCIHTVPSGPPSPFTEVAKWLDDGSRFCVGAEIERFLIRIAVRSGAPIGNSASAGQWESMIGRYSDTLAFISHTTKG